MTIHDPGFDFDAEVRAKQRQAVREIEEVIESRTFELVYVDHRDELNDEQIDMYLADDEIGLDDSIWEWVADQRAERAVSELDDIIRELDLDDLEVTCRQDLDTSDEDNLRSMIEERDESDPIADLVRNTPNQLFRVTIARPDRAWYIMRDEEYNKAAAWVAGQLYGVGVPLLPAARFARDLLNECGDWIHDGHTLDVIWYGDIKTAKKAGVGDKLTFQAGANILLLDRVNGSGHDDAIVFPVTIPITEDNRPHLDRTGGGYGWEAVAGTYNPAYGDEPTIEKG